VANKSVTCSDVTIIYIKIVIY